MDVVPQMKHLGFVFLAKILIYLQLYFNLFYLI